jgi:hypothetical protein
MFMFEAVTLKGVRECEPEMIENMAAIGLKGAEAPFRKRPGYPGCRRA